jgi:NAD(P)H-hydrate epimerase
MKPAFTYHEIRQAEKTIIEKEGVPSLILMENAGKNAFVIISSFIPGLVIENRAVYIFCGKGNNAGDGYVIARHFAVAGVPVSVINICSASELKGDALTNFLVLQKLNSPLVSFIEGLNGSFEDELKKLKGDVLIIDAILGSGAKGEISAPFSAAIDLINSIRGKDKKSMVVSVDVPSGLKSDGDSKHVVKADHTITMGAIKTELLYVIGKENSGSIEVVPIGIPDELLERYNSGKMYMTELEDVQGIFPKRRKTSYKYSNGKALVIGGSKGLSGAIIMSSLSALKSGAGAVLAAFPRSVSPHFSKKLFEVIKTELSESQNGSLPEEAYGELRLPLKKADAVLLGPGISTNLETAAFVKRMVAECAKPMVIDADALTVIAEDVSILLNRNSGSDLILTPHLGEFSRLSGRSVEEIRRDMFSIAREFTSKYNLNLILKSETSFACTPNGEIYLNSSGNEQLASAGSGDVLSGILVSLLAQTNDCTSAMICGNYLHGMAADIYSEQSGNRQSALQQDLINCIPEAISRIVE